MALEKDVRELNIPFGVDATGAIGYSQSLGDIYSNRLVSIIGTLFGERVMRGGYGSTAASYAFEPIDEITIDSLKENITAAVNLWEPGVTIVDITTDDTVGLSSLVLNVMFSINADAASTLVLTSDTLTIYTASISIGGTVTEF